MEKHKRRNYPRLTSFSQRKLMIETYLNTHNISKSCRKAGVAINTFRRWYPRYIEKELENLKVILINTWEESMKSIKMRSLN